MHGTRRFESNGSTPSKRFVYTIEKYLKNSDMKQYALSERVCEAKGDQLLLLPKSRVVGLAFLDGKIMTEKTNILTLLLVIS